MGNLEKMKERYDHIFIPEELNLRVQREIQKSREQQEGKRKSGGSHRFKTAIRSIGAAAAAVCILFTAALNTSSAFAKEAEQLPVIGGLARVLTFRSYETQKDDIAVSVEIPTIEMIAEATGITVDEINQEILARCSQYADEAVLRAESYRTAFLETGGTLEEWAAHNIKITVDYEIKQQSNDYLSFVVRGFENWTNAYNESMYYNLDLSTGKIVTLEDMLGDDYVELANRSIREQIAERQKSGETFFTAEQGGFTGISEDVKFYINENNRPVIVFERYEIAPGSSGEIEFEIGENVQDSSTPEKAEAETVNETVQAPEEYEDNFAVDSEAAKEFAEKIKEATAQKDLEALAELTAFPVYVGLPDAGVVETKEDFLNLGAETVFTDELLESVEMADIDNLKPSMAGFSISGNRNVEGTGLGLTIARQLMEMMGGRIYVDSVYHKGSIFTVEIRQHIVNPQPIGIIDFAAQNRLANRAKYRQRFVAPDARVLVVDDNDMNRMVAVKLLRGTRVKVDTASGGKECLKKTAENTYHVILMDHMMPDMDGEETLKAVREQTKGFCQKTPVIALTANVMSDANQVYQDMGFDGYLAKPVNAALLETSLLKYLPKELVEYFDDENNSSDSVQIGTINQLNSGRKRKVAITADCICDLPKELLDRFQIRLMYTYVHTKEGRFCDLSEVSCDSLLEYLQIEGNDAHSSTASPAEYEYFFADTLEKAEHVLHITATASLSGAYPNASQASKSFDNVTVFDSEHISSGHGLMVLYAASLAEEGKSTPEICEALEQFKELVCSNFLVPNTAALYRNGKLGGMVHKLCSSLNLHPVLRMSENKLKLWKIETGNMRRMDRKYVRALLHNSRQIDKRLLFLTYAGCSVRQLDEILAEVEKYVRFDKIILQKASATVSSNCGIGIFGLMFVRKREF